MIMMECRGCGSKDLAPVRGGDAFRFCRRCLLVQRDGKAAPGRVPASVFGPLDRLVERHGLRAESLVVGVDAAPLLERIADDGIPVLAIEQDRAEAAKARAAGIPVVEARFGPELADALAAGGRRADLALVPAFGRLEDPAGAAVALARLVAVSGAVEIAFASAAEILPHGAWAAAAAEATLPTLGRIDALLETEGLHLNDAGRAGRHHLLRAAASPERRCTGRLAGLLEEERRVGAHSARFYGGVPAASGARWSGEEGAGAVP
jgi:hypothetical protein